MNSLESKVYKAMKYPVIQGETNSSKKRYLKQSMDEEGLDAKGQV